MPLPSPAASITPSEMELLVSRSGLTLNPGQMADLVLAWRQVAGLIATLPRDRPLCDDQAFVFQLPPTQGKRRKGSDKPGTARTSGSALKKR